MSNFIKSKLEEFCCENRTTLTKYLVYSLSFPIGDVIVPQYYGKLTKNAMANDFKDIKWNASVLAGYWILNKYLGNLLDGLDIEFIPKLKSFVRTSILRVYIDSLCSEYSDPPIGMIMHQIIKLPSLVVGIFNVVRTVMLPALLVILVGTASILYHDRTLGAIVVGFLVVAYLMMREFIDDLLRQTGNVDDLQAELHEETSDILSNLLGIFGSFTVDKDTKRFKDYQERYDKSIRDALDRVRKIKGRFYSLFAGMFFSVMALAVYKYSIGEIGLDSLLSLIFILESIVEWLNSVVYEMKNFVFDIGMVLSIEKSITSLPIKKITRVDFDLIPTPNSIFSVRNLSIEFENPNNKEIKKIEYPDFDVMKNDIFVIDSINGRGKSTLIHILMGLKGYRGDVFYNGGPLERSISNASYIPQSTKLFNRTIWENIFHADLNLDTPTNRDAIKSFLSTNKIELGDLERKAGKDGRKLSGGQIQIVYLLRIMMQNKDVVLLDEPGTSLDSDKIKLLVDILTKLHRDGKTIILVSHQSDIKSLATHSITF